jgi:hypothetical protein
MVIRPDWVVMGGPLIATVREVWYRGPYTDYKLETAAGHLEARIPGPPQASSGDRLGWGVTRGWIPGEATVG